MTYNKIIQKIKQWSNENDDIRAVIIIGSMARSIEPADEFSDLDIVFLTKNIEFYENNIEWIKKFGNPIVYFTEPTFTGSFEQRVLYDDFLDVDFILGNSDKFNNLLNNFFLTIIERGYRFIIDKDNYEKILSGKEKTKEDRTININNISNEINNYWFHCIWLSKKILRGELLVAVKCLNLHLTQRLLYMIEIYKKTKSDFTADTWHDGRFIEKWADSSIIEEIKGCFTDYDKQNIIKSLYHQMNFYYDLSLKVTNYHGIKYPEDAKNKIICWIKANLK